MTKAFIDEKQRKVRFIFTGLPEDVERFLENVWRDPVALTKLTDREFLAFFLAFLAGLLASDGTIVRSRGIVEVTIVGNLKKKTLYAVVQGELGRRLDFSVQFALKHMRKDLDIINREAERPRLPMPIVTLALQLYRLAEGLAEEDFAAVIKVLAR